MAEVEAVVIENNVTNYVLSKVKTKVTDMGFEELMGQA
jgi:trigger factor